MSVGDLRLEFGELTWLGVDGMEEDWEEELSRFLQ